MPHRVWAIALLLVVPSARADEPTALTMDQLIRMNKCQLESLYRAGHYAEVPLGFSPGRAIMDAGSDSTVRKAKLTRIMWRGKIIREDGTMINRVLGGRAIVAKTFSGTSWLDGGPAYIMDYAETSKLFPDIRDEVREVAPGLFLGITYRRKCPQPEIATFFTLDAR